MSKKKTRYSEDCQKKDNDFNKWNNSYRKPWCISQSATVFWPRLCPFVFYNYSSFMSFRLTSSRRTSANLWLRKFLVYECGLSGYLSVILLPWRLFARTCVRVTFTRALTRIIAWAEMLIHYNEFNTLHRFIFLQRVHFLFHPSYKSSCKYKQSTLMKSLKSLDATHHRGYQLSQICSLFVDSVDVGANEATA